MGSAKGVVDVELRKLGQLLRKLLVVLLLLGVEAQVLEQQSLALFELEGHFFGFLAHTLGAEADVFAA